jgi:hypothetical protein
MKYILLSGVWYEADFDLPNRTTGTMTMINESTCDNCGGGTDDGRITFVGGECYSCAKSTVGFGTVPVSPDGCSINEMRERHKEAGRINLGVDIVDANIGDLRE